ncbi:MAG: hypothetical protein UV95_C0003G0106 [Candidatus Falkowbacteria bacterium GW2011_GWF2_43_32]|nr:MAG: hypothetical protein UV95_C0003G0106 [Candidatus Falkowbacteria bacterium GW2011_GWF2_43_32]
MSGKNQMRKTVPDSSKLRRVPVKSTLSEEDHCLTSYQLEKLNQPPERKGKPRWD